MNASQVGYAAQTRDHINAAIERLSHADLPSTVKTATQQQLAAALAALDSTPEPPMTDADRDRYLSYSSIGAAILRDRKKKELGLPVG
jgi:hypothetical protein